MAVPTGAAVAAAALRYNGQDYIYGGTGAQPGDWDCSSYASYVLGHDLRLGLPGGTWAQVTRNGTLHGPVVVTYATWGGAVTIPGASAQPGDLVLWVGVGTGGHMGFVLGPDKMISALDPEIRGNAQTGTAVTPIDGWGPPVTPIYRRVKASATGPIPQLAGATGTGWGGMLAALAAGLAVGAGAIALVVGAALGLVAGAMWLAGRAAREVT